MDKSSNSRQIGRRLVFRLIRWDNGNLVSSAAVITLILLLMSMMAMITHLVGLHTVLGALFVGRVGRRIPDPDQADRGAAARPA